MKDLRYKHACQVSVHTPQSVAEAADCRESLVAQIEYGCAPPDLALNEINPIFIIRQRKESK